MLKFQDKFLKMIGYAANTKFQVRFSNWAQTNAYFRLVVWVVFKFHIIAYLS